VERILVIGANGQIGSELVEALGARHGAENVIAADIGAESLHGAERYESLDVLDRERVTALVERNDITQVVQLAALLSVTGEQEPMKAWTLNMNGLLNILEIARERSKTGKPLKVFWPSSIAAFGPHTPAEDTPQLAVMDPTTIYGISKQAGERLCEYYARRFSVDVRSIRYPGIISYKSPPGGGTTDYAIAMLDAAAREQPYTCYLGPETVLPMMYMPDAVRATLTLMEASSDQIRVRSAYNVAGVSFTPQELAQSIRRRIPQFEVRYHPDHRQAIAAGWPHSLDDTHARADWGWKAEFDLEELVDDMLLHLRETRHPQHDAA
jgi:nucleoside-diphosphate-sugar epimerase